MNKGIVCYRMSWTVNLEGGPRRVNHAAVAVGELIYSFGGYCTGDNYLWRKPMDVHVLNTGNYRWTALPSPLEEDRQWIHIPYQRYGHTAVAYGKLVYVWGGRNDDSACNILFCFDTTTCRWSSPPVKGIIPGARDGHSACIINHRMYVFGGFEEDIDRFSQDVHALDLRTMQWQYIPTKGEPPSYRDFHSATALGTRMYIFGGRGDVNGPYHSQNEVYNNQIMYLDTLGHLWNTPDTPGDIPKGRRSHSAFEFKGGLYIFGGYNSLYEEHFNDLYRFSPDEARWTLVKVPGMPPCKRRRQSCLVVGDRVFLFGGTSPYFGPTPPGAYDTDMFYAEGHNFKLVDHSDLHVLDLAPSLRTLCLLKVIEHQLNPAWLPQSLQWEILAMTTNNKISRPLNNTG